MSKKTFFNPPDTIIDFLRDCRIEEENLRKGCLRLSRLAEMLTEYNQKFNLTRISGTTDFWRRHVADSVLITHCFPDLARLSLRVADIGSGAGFPLFPLACFYPGLRITGMEATLKKVLFMQMAATVLELQNVDAVHQQAREAACKSDWRRSFDIITARAVASSARLLRESRHLLKSAPGSRIIFYKTPASLTVEMSQLERECCKFGFSCQLSPVFNLPGNLGERQFAICRLAF